MCKKTLIGLFLLTFLSNIANAQNKQANNSVYVDGGVFTVVVASIYSTTFSYERKLFGDEISTVYLRTGLGYAGFSSIGDFNQQFAGMPWDSRL